MLPTDQTRDYSKVVVEMEVETMRLDDEMCRLRQVMDSLARERQNLAQSLDEHRSLVAPIRRIPQEMLSEIFSHCIGSLPCIEGDSAPMLLTFVCSRWRRVVISSPALWSNIYVAYYDRPSVNMLEIWLARSGVFPLRLSVESENKNNNAIRSLIPHSHRWHTVMLSLHPEQYRVLAPIAGNVPILESLTLSVTDDFNKPLTIFEAAPRLHSVRLLRSKPSDW